MRDVYITSCGAYLPGEPVTNDQIERFLGPAGSGRVRDRILEANGIVTRHYALAEGGSTTMLNEELAERAVLAALARRGVGPEAVGLLAVGTTQGDLPVPGFASMVHARLGGGPMETLSAGGVCCSSIAALRAAAAAVRTGEHDLAVVVGSELVSRALRAERTAGAGPDGPFSFDAEFLRWMLSDGAGAVVLEPAPPTEALSLRIDWSHLRSHAHRYPLCMYSGVAQTGEAKAGSTWQDQLTPSEADRAGMLNLRQDTGVLPAIVALGVEEYVGLVRAGRIDPDQIDHLLCHYSSEFFRGDIVKLMADAGLMIPEERWFTNLHTKGNTGAASIFIMLEEAFSAGRFKPGDRILLMVPESGRFTVSFVHLTAVTGAASARATTQWTPAEMPVAPAPPPPAASEDRQQILHDMFAGLASVWADFERRLAEVPMVARIERREATLDDYRRLLLNLRQQVVEGARWIARAASNLGAELADIRGEFIHHAAEEHFDFRMLEENYAAVGGSIEDIRSGEKNIGSEALSAFMFQEASRPDPLHLLGAMFVIEGLGVEKADRWARLLADQLDLESSQVSFLSYHGAADEDHTDTMYEVMRSEHITAEVAARIVKTAKVVARLYALQLEELDNV